MAAKPDNKASEKTETPAKRGKALWIGALVLLVAGAGIGAGWYFTRPAAAEDSAEVQESPKHADTVFVNLEPFTVNLADEGGERLAQVAIVLELSDKESEQKLAKHLPIVRNDMLLLLSSQHTSTLLTLDGKLALAREIAVRSGTALGWKPPAPVDAAGAASGKDAGVKAAPKAGAAKGTAGGVQPNPVVAVHFSQLLVQ